MVDDSVCHEGHSKPGKTSTFNVDQQRSSHTHSSESDDWDSVVLQDEISARYPKRGCLNTSGKTMKRGDSGC
jgi:hypothetical protein